MAYQACLPTLPAGRQGCALPIANWYDCFPAAFRNPHEADRRNRFRQPTACLSRQIAVVDASVADRKAYIFTIVLPFDCVMHHGPLNHAPGSCAVSCKLLRLRFLVTAPVQPECTDGVNATKAPPRCSPTAMTRLHSEVFHASTINRFGMHPSEGILIVIASRF